MADRLTKGMLVDAATDLNTRLGFDPPILDKGSADEIKKSIKTNVVGEGGVVASDNLADETWTVLELLGVSPRGDGFENAQADDQDENKEPDEQSEDDKKADDDKQNAEPEKPKKRRGRPPRKSKQEDPPAPTSDPKPEPETDEQQQEETLQMPEPEPQEPEVQESPVNERKPAPIERPAPQPAYAPNQPLGRIEAIYQSIRNLCNSEPGASLAEIFVESDRLAGKSCTSTNTHMYVLGALVAFGVLRKDNLGRYMFR